MSYKSEVVVVASCTKRSQALEAYVQPGAQIPIDGVAHKGSEVIALYQRCIDDRKALAEARAEVKTKMAAVAASESERQKADEALGPWVKAHFGAGSKEAIAFGFADKVPAARASADKARAVDLARATRKARGTMGKKEKAKIKGTLPAIEVTVGAPAAAAPPGTNGVGARS